VGPVVTSTGETIKEPIQVEAKAYMNWFFLHNSGSIERIL